jgi:hypothetical protein
MPLKQIKQHQRKRRTICHGCLVGFIMHLHREHQLNKIKLLPLKKINQIKRFNNWQDEVIDWYNDWIDESNENKLNKKQLLIYGEPDTAKTYFIVYFLFAKYEKQRFMPCPSEYMFPVSDYDSRRYNILIEDEFDIKNYDLDIWKSIVDGKQMNISMNSEKPKLECFNMPMIFISPYEPDLTIEGFESRLKIVKAVGRVDRNNFINLNEFVSFD